MLQVVQGRIQITHTYRGNQECCNKFTNRSKSDKYAQSNNQLHFTGPNSFSFLWTRIIYIINKEDEWSGPRQNRITRRGVVPRTLSNFCILSISMSLAKFPYNRIN